MITKSNKWSSTEAEFISTKTGSYHHIEASPELSISLEHHPEKYPLDSSLILTVGTKKILGNRGWLYLIFILKIEFMLQKFVIATKKMLLYVP